MKYINEYNETNSKKEFIKLLLERYPKLKLATATRRYYDVRKSPKQEIKPEINIDNSPIDYLKYRQLLDMKRLGYKITKQLLRSHGFDFEDIEKLKEAGEKIEDVTAILRPGYM